MSSVLIAGDTSGSITLSAPAVSGSSVLTLPVATDTLVGKATTDTLTNKTLTTPIINQFSSASATNLTIQSAGTTAITIDTSGNVGIGTISPTQKLEVAGTITSSSTTTLPVILVSSSQAAGYTPSNIQMRRVGASNTTTPDNQLLGQIRFDGLSVGSVYDNAAFIQVESGVNASGGMPSSMTFGTASSGANAVERMRIDSSGNLLVGKTSTGAFTTQGIEIAPSSTSANLAVTSTSATNYDMVRLTRTGTTGIMIGFFNGASRVGDVSIGASSTSYNTSSDYRLKHDINPMTGALALIAALKPCTYKWNADGSSGQGFIAHELQEVVPDCVTGTKDAVETYTDKDGNEATRPVYQGIDTSFLVATLTAAIQEQQALITAQAETINALTARVVALESKA